MKNFQPTLQLILVYYVDERPLQLYKQRNWRALFCWQQ